MVPDSTPPRFVNSQQVGLLPVRIFNKLSLHYLFSVHNVNTAVLKTNWHLTNNKSDLFVLFINAYKINVNYWLFKMAATWISCWWCNYHVWYSIISCWLSERTYFCRVSLEKDLSQEANLNMSWFQTSLKRPFQSLKNSEDVSTVVYLNL